MSLNPLSSWLADEPIDPVFLSGVLMAPRLNLTAVKRQHDRFNPDFEVSAFDSGSIFDRGSERSREVRDEERDAERDQARFEARWGCEE